MVDVTDLELYINYRKTEWTEAEERLLSMLLKFSAEKILNHKFPFGYKPGTEVPAQYENLQLKVAAELFSRIGAFGQYEHDENGIKRTWESDDIAHDMLQSEVIPSAGVF